MTHLKQIGGDLIAELQKIRGSEVVVYFTGDRFPVPAQIAEDAVRPLYEHLLNLFLDEDEGKDQEKKVVDLFLYSRGGNVGVPWRIASMIREFCDEFNVVIPYKAQSAATLLSLGADNIVMGRKAELGPIDPSLVRATVGEGALPHQEISVEDVNSFLSFVSERAHITDQSALAQTVGRLVDEIGALSLGTVNRENSHIRLVARKLLTTRTSSKLDEERIDAIIETLTEKTYSHAHGIARKEAKDIGLPVVEPASEVEELIWQLYLLYEDFLKLNDPISPEVELAQDEKKVLRDLPVAVIESVHRLHVHRVHMDMRNNRKVPPSPQINLNLNLQLPQGVQPAQLPSGVQQAVQQLMAQIGGQITQLVQQEIARQSPLVGIAVRVYGGKWYDEK